MHRLKFNYLIFIFFVGLLNTKAQQTKLYIKGFVVGVDTTAPIPLANIHNITTQTRYITNRYGAFGITVSVTDTIEFSVIGYKTYTLICKDYTKQGDVPIIVKLKRNYIKLKEVTISSQKRKQDSMARAAAKRLRTDPLLNNFSTSISIYNASQGGILSSILASGNKKIQEYEHLMRLIEIYQEQNQVSEKYNVELVMRTTQLNELQAKELMKYCEIPNYFVLNSNEYDIILAIKNCYKEWKNIKR
ncbi:MAG: carboxypeptidase-like regulatory domain-containing protein [Bacteroidia bacterium]